MPRVQIDLAFLLKLQTALNICIGNPILCFQSHFEVSRSINLHRLKLREVFRMFKCPNAAITLVLRMRLHIIVQNFGTIIEVFTHKRDKENQFVIRFQESTPYLKYKAHNHNIQLLNEPVVFQNINQSIPHDSCLFLLSLTTTATLAVCCVTADQY
jgi:hypothetical protein